PRTGGQLGNSGMTQGNGPGQGGDVGRHAGGDAPRHLAGRRPRHRPRHGAGTSPPPPAAPTTPAGPPPTAASPTAAPRPPAPPWPSPPGEDDDLPVTAEMPVVDDVVDDLGPVPPVLALHAGAWYARGLVLQLERRGVDVGVPASVADEYGRHRVADP